MKKRVLHVRSTIGMYGAERVVANLMPVLKHHSDYASCFLIEGESAGSKKLGELLNLSKVPCESVRSTRKLDFTLIKSLRALIKRNQINIVHTHDYKSLIHATIAVLGLKVKKIHHVHGSLGNTINEKVYALVENAFKRFSDKVLFVNSEMVKDKVFTQKKNKHQFLANGIPVEKDLIKPNVNKPLKIVMAARFTHEKNHKLAVDIANGLKNRNIDFQLSLLGDGELESEISHLVVEKELTDRIQMMGFVDNVSEWLVKADLLLITSITEGMPMSLLEAMSYGVPAVSTEVGSIPEIISISGAGRIAKSAEQFVDAIAEYANSDSKLKLEGDLAREYITNNLSIDKQTMDLTNIYDQVLGLSCA